MNIVKLNQSHIHLLEKFCYDCKLASFENNSSLEKMKWGGSHDLKEPPDFWALIVNDEIASISGCHYFGDYSPGIKQIRCLYRSATLPKYSKLIPGMSKNHMNSVPFSLLLPYQLLDNLEKGNRYFYITTSSGDHDASGKMKKTHKAISLIAKRKIVDFISEEIIYSTLQTKWKIVLPNYFQALLSFRSIRDQIGVSPNFDYLRLSELIKNSIK
jgi:hypothetical protein